MQVRISKMITRTLSVSAVVEGSSEELLDVKPWTPAIEDEDVAAVREGSVLETIKAIREEKDEEFGKRRRS